PHTTPLLFTYTTLFRSVAKRCLDFGLYRVQKSVFLGDLESNRVEEILLFSRDLLDLETDSVYIFPMCRPDFERVRIVGQGFDREDRKSTRLNSSHRTIS